MELDRTNGEKGLGDGGPILLNGVSYARGIGTHAYSEVTYSVLSQYSEFLSDVSVDDDTGGGGSIVFQVYADGAKLSPLTLA